jgi:hypothetical protein
VEVKEDEVIGGDHGLTAMGKVPSSIPLLCQIRRHVGHSRRTVRESQPCKREESLPAHRPP